MDILQARCNDKRLQKIKRLRVFFNIPPVWNGSHLINEDTFVRCKRGRVFLYKGSGAPVEVMIAAREINKVKIWRNEQGEELIAVCEKHEDLVLNFNMDCILDNRLRVWSLRENRIIYDLTNVSNIFDDGFYAVIVRHNSVHATFQIKRFSNEADHLIRDDTGHPLELTSIPFKELIQLNNGNFVTLSFQSYDLVLWTRYRTRTEVTTGHTSK